MPLAQPLATKEPYGCGIPLAGASRRVFRTQNRWRQQRRARVSPPYTKGVVFAPKPKLCVGRDAHIAPRIPDAESMVPAAAGSGEPALRKRGGLCAQAQTLRRPRCPHRAAYSGRRIDGASSGRSRSTPTAETEDFTFYRRHAPSLWLFSPSVTASPCRPPHQRKVSGLAKLAQ